MRNLVEGNVLAHCLDHLARGRYDQAADILAQRFTAVEADMRGMPWEKAKFLELVEMDDNSLIGRHERALVASESSVEQKLKGSGATLTSAATVAHHWQGKGGPTGKNTWESAYSKGSGEKGNPFRDQEQEVELEDPNGMKFHHKGKGGKKEEKGKWSW